jgi:hypothetical protein
MSQISRAVLGLIALSVSFGAVQFALGRDLPSGLQATEATPATAVNRDAKADRAAAVAGSAVPMRTIALRLDGLPAMSVLLRVPMADAARTGSPVRSLMKPANGKTAAACEPMVSVLTEVAKLLQPGRCVT